MSALCQEQTTADRFHSGKPALRIPSKRWSRSAGFLNGRRLQDDVIDISLNLVTNGGLTGDGVGPHTDYLSDFPYLGQPH